MDLDLSPLLLEIFRDGQARFGPREWSPNIIRRLEQATGLTVTAAGFPAEIVDDEDRANMILEQDDHRTFMIIHPTHNLVALT